MATIDELKAAAAEAAAALEAAMKAEEEKALAAAPRTAGNILNDILLEVANQFHNHPKIEGLVQEYVAATTPPPAAEPEKKA